MAKSDSTEADRALLAFVEDHRKELESFAASDRQTAGLAEALLERADGVGCTDEEAEG